MASTKSSPSELYQHDYYAWIQEQVEALRAHRIEEIDWANVAEEMEDLGKSEKRSIESQMIRLLEHLLKLQYGRESLRRNNARVWHLSVLDARLGIQHLLQENPSLRAQAAEMLSRAYPRGRLAALRKAKLPDEAIPESSPWSIEQVMADNFLPETI